ncbi:hypothetical protein SDC9_75588 [bioreactor metagenome]|uniref:Uncharacterized protein n=1 Tax=bioreactor metagenome TaxID=1076179 RepID=A0A644YL47_9ZZZZ
MAFICQFFPQKIKILRLAQFADIAGFRLGQPDKDAHHDQRFFFGEGSQSQCGYFLQMDDVRLPFQ